LIARVTCSLQFVVALLAAFLTLSAAKAATPGGLDDPVAYCQAVGTIDAPDAKYKGPAVPDWMVAKAYPPEAIKAQKTPEWIRKGRSSGAALPARC
jgi:hypothetical protein